MNISALSQPSLRTLSASARFGILPPGKDKALLWLKPGDVKEGHSKADSLPLVYPSDNLIKRAEDLYTKNEGLLIIENAKRKRRKIKPILSEDYFRRFALGLCDVLSQPGRLFGGLKQKIVYDRKRCSEETPENSKVCNIVPHATHGHWDPQYYQAVCIYDGPVPTSDQNTTGIETLRPLDRRIVDFNEIVKAQTIDINQQQQTKNYLRNTIGIYPQYLTPEQESLGLIINRDWGAFVIHSPHRYLHWVEQGLSILNSLGMPYGFIGLYDPNNSKVPSEIKTLPVETRDEIKRGFADGTGQSRTGYHIQGNT